ncbi:MAG: 4Fe-4S dicluster domain-containing protein [Deltaproteobacteria bacterium]|nr:4Fe-4S dicluster domain-containing protein [Deltaproteobacteria bacterium]
MGVSRRDFIKGVAIGSLAAAGTAKANSVRRFKGYEDTTGLLYDSTLCIGCRQCEKACNEVNDLPPVEPPIGDKSVFDHKRKVSDKQYTVVNRYKKAEGNKPPVFRKHQCMHCQEPTCASVCFVSAFTKTPEGPVLYNPDVCVGCRYCVFACPYYAISYEFSDPFTPKVARCTMCYPRIKKGLKPACSEACPTGAIQYGKRKDLLELARDRIRKNPGKYVHHIFGENEYGGTSWLTIAGLPPEDLDLPKDPMYEPLPNLTTGFLSLAPIAAATIPGLLAGFYAFTKRKENLHKEELSRKLKETKKAMSIEMEEKLLKAGIEMKEALDKVHDRGAAPPAAPSGAHGSEAPDDKRG